MIPKNRCAAGATLLICGGVLPRTTPGYLGVWMGAGGVLVQVVRREVGSWRGRGSRSDGTYQGILRNLYWGTEDLHRGVNA